MIKTKKLAIKYGFKIVFVLMLFMFFFQVSKEKFSRFKEDNESTPASPFCMKLKKTVLRLSNLYNILRAYCRPCSSLYNDRYILYGFM
jgi:hypothetical protein